MSGKAAYLALYLDAPLQSWGYQSKFDRRTTLSYPTRSGVLGMLCAALGIERDDTDALAPFSALEMQVVVFQQQSRLVDFHTVGGGWDKKLFPGNVVRKAGDKPGANSGTTVVTHREYLESARFGVVLSGGQELVERCAHAMQHPRWGLWLGRKACVPASPVFQGVFQSCEEAIEVLGNVATSERRRSGDGLIKRVIKEVDQFEDGTDTLMDMPLDFAKRTFAPRRVDVDIP